jgi:A/G-specific adenine glycosylase
MATRAAASLVRSRAAFQGALAGWYRAHARALPWRGNPSLYRTVVSEFMLQQTQVRTVLPYFARWLDAFPDFESLAAAPEDRVLRLWEGLGYYARARNLHRLARILAGGAAAPRDAASWIGMPGVGPYTAAAIASIAFGDPVACVDGNVVRILARLTGDATPFPNGAAAVKALAPVAGRLVPAESPGDHNQAMMELGATVCLRAAPLCGICPVHRFCAAAKKGDPAALPRLAPKPSLRRVVARVWCERGGALLLHRAGAAGGRLAGLHELPTAEQAGIPAAEASRGPLLATGKRSITKYRITESIHRARPPEGPLRPGLAWVPLADLDIPALSGPHRRWVKEILSAQKPGT